MPPEVADLVEVKKSQKLFEKSFAEIERHSGLHEVRAYIEAYPPEAGQQSSTRCRKSSRALNTPTRARIEIVGNLSRRVIVNFYRLNDVYDETGAA